MDEPSVQLQLDLRHAIQHELAARRPILHRLHGSTYILQIPRPSHAVRHGSRFFYNILVDPFFADLRATPKQHPKLATGNAIQTINGVEELLRDIELLAGESQPEARRKSNGSAEDELERLETIVDAAVVKHTLPIGGDQLRQLHPNVPVFARQDAIDAISHLEHFRTVVPLAMFGDHGYKDWRNGALPPLPEWIGVCLLKAEDDVRASLTLLIAFNNHHHNHTAKLRNQSVKSYGRRKRHETLIPNEDEESAEAIFFTEGGLSDADIPLASFADPPLYPLAVLRKSSGEEGWIRSMEDGEDRMVDCETPQKYEAKYCLYERVEAPERGRGFLAWLIAAAQAPFNVRREGRARPLGSSRCEKGGDDRSSEQVALSSGESKVLL